MSLNYRMQICQSIGEIAQAHWNSMLLASNEGVLHPAMRHEYLFALENSGAASAETGWGPMHLCLTSETGETLGAMPLYIKSHSYGEYVFDWAWAQAYERNGMPYYPKLLSAIPFTPVIAPKLLAHMPAHRQALANAAGEIAVRCAQSDAVLGCRTSSFHALFLTTNDQIGLLDDANPLHADSRHVVQFHWENKHPQTLEKFKNFEDFINSLSQKKRKNIRAERRKALLDNIQIQRISGTDATEEQLEFFYNCYANTYAGHGSTPYLNLAFFREICATMGEQVLLVLALADGNPVASSFFLHSSERLYGRYWGSTANIACLHFELCYYQAIEFAIERGIGWFEGGAQGEHKMARGLNPVTLKSAHWVYAMEFKEPIRRFLEREKAHLQAYEVELSEHQAFKNRDQGL